MFDYICTSTPCWDCPYFMNCLYSMYGFVPFTLTVVDGKIVSMNLEYQNENYKSIESK